MRAAGAGHPNLYTYIYVLVVVQGHACMGTGGSDRLCRGCSWQSRAPETVTCTNRSCDLPRDLPPFLFIPRVGPTPPFPLHHPVRAAFSANTEKPRNTVKSAIFPHRISIANPINGLSRPGLKEDCWYIWQ